MAHEDQSNLNRLWQDQPAQEVSMTLDDIRKRVRKWERTVDRRNLLEYAGALFVIVSTAMNVRHETNVIVLVGGWLLVLGTLYVVYHLHRWGSARSMPADVALMDCLSFHRAELGRQRDLLRGVWWWYLLPFVPGSALIIIGRAIERPDRRLLALGVAAAFVVSFTLIGKLNARAARKLQAVIDGLDRTR
jgi:hypothetical protein